MELPMEDFEEGRGGRLRKDRCGVRHAAQEWELEHADFDKESTVHVCSTTRKRT